MKTKAITFEKKRNEVDKHVRVTSVERRNKKNSTKKKKSSKAFLIHPCMSRFLPQISAYPDISLNYPQSNKRKRTKRCHSS